MQPHLGLILSVLPPRPDHHQQVGHTEAAHGGHNHGVVLEGGKEVGSLADVNVVGHHQERASKEGEVVAEAVCLGVGGPWPHLQPQRGPGGNASVSLAPSSPGEVDTAMRGCWGEQL